MPTKSICAKCDREIPNLPITVGFYRGDTKATDKVCTDCYDGMTKDWKSKPQFEKK